VEHPGDRFKIGDELTVKVLGVEQDSRKISLGLKQLSDDPVERFFSAWPVKSIVTCKVKEVAADGSCVLELPEQAVGYVQAKHAVKEIEAGAEVNAKVLEYSMKDRKVYLSIKQAEKEIERSVCEEYNKTAEKATEVSATPVTEQLASLKAELEKEERDAATKKATKEETAAE
jgi:small subunit ribosomal protein S1